MLFRDPDGNLVNLFQPVTEEAIKRFSGRGVNLGDKTKHHPTRIIDVQHNHQVDLIDLNTTHLTTTVNYLQAAVVKICAILVVTVAVL
ncbi:hypothetical protein DP091_25815 [Paenibacillus sp. MDMC362]|nr:hypothetical protein DP091_25815 [Paenibacillus sp. MDMC362]